MPAKAGIQYSETPVMESRTRGVLDTPPSRSMTAVDGASERYRDDLLQFSPPHSGPTQPSTRSESGPNTETLLA